MEGEEEEGEEEKEEEDKEEGKKRCDSSTKFNLKTMIITSIYLVFCLHFHPLHVGLMRDSCPWLKPFPLSSPS